MAQHEVSIEEALGLSHPGGLLDDKEHIGGMGHQGVMLDDKAHIGGMSHDGVMLDDKEPMGFSHRSILMHSHSTGPLNNHLQSMQVSDSCSSRPDSVHGHTLSSVRPVGCPDPGLLSNIFQDPPLDPPLPCPEPLIVPLRLSDQIVPATSYIDSTFHLFTSSPCPLNNLPNFSNLSSSSSCQLNNFNNLTNSLSVLDPPLTSTVTLTIPDFSSLSPLPAQKSCEDVRLSVLAKSWTEDLTGYLTSGLWADVEIRCGEKEQFTFRCHKMLLAAASPFLSRCLRSVSEQDEIASLVLPDFTVQQVREFLNTVYLQWREVGEGTPDALLNFLSDQPLKSDLGLKNNSNTDFEFVKFEEKVKKMPVEVKMEEATGSDLLGNILSANDAALESGDTILAVQSDDADKKNKKEKKSGPHTCDKCGKVFKLPRILKEHMQLHDEPKYECSYKSQGCVRKFHLKANLKAHIDVIHLKKKNIPCEICGKLFYNKTHLRNHLEHHNTQKQICEHCSSSFSCTKSLRDHIKFKHTSQENLPKCLVCLKTYSTPQNLKNHFNRVHMQEKKYVCSECGRMFFEKAELEVHTSVHNPEDQNIECDVCKLMFKNNKTLYYHKKRSHDPHGKKHICHLCGKSYNDAHFLNRHMESHQGKNFQCKQCGKAFVSEHQVKVHVKKVHEKWRRKNEPEKPCPLCDRKFPTWGGMKRHLKDVHKMSVIEANTLLVQRFRLDPKKHRMNPAEIMPSSISTNEISTNLLDNLC